MPNEKMINCNALKVKYREKYIVKVFSTSKKIVIQGLFDMMFV